MNSLGRFVFNWSELLLTSFVAMLVAGALGASLDWGTISFWQALGGVYLLKTLVSTAAVTLVNTVHSTLKTLDTK